MKIAAIVYDEPVDVVDVVCVDSVELVVSGRRHQSGGDGVVGSSIA